MPRFNDDLDDEFLDDDDVYSELDNEFGDDVEPTILCSRCGFEMLEIIYQCPRCGEIPSRELDKSSTQPQWVICTALVLVGVILCWILI